MSWARNLLDEKNTHAHMSSSQKDCALSVGDLRPQGLGRVCQVIWDGMLCWPPTLAGTTIKQPCPDIFQFNTRQSAYKHCMRNGSWYGDWIPDLPQGWTNYSMCVHSNIVNHLRVDVMSGETSVTASSSTTAMVTSESAPILHTSGEVIGTVLHGVSSVSLLLAIVTWITLRLTDRLATRRYQLLTAGLVAAFLFHVIFLTSHFQTMATALSAGVDGTVTAPVRASGTPQPGLAAGTQDESAERDAGTGGRTMNPSHGGVEPGTYVTSLLRHRLLLQSTAYDVVTERESQSSPSGASRKSSDKDSWMTLCEVGRAFFYLSDVGVYSFLFAMSLYYTLVVLDNTLNFNRLLTLFLLGLGVPVVFVVFSILLYTFMPHEDVPCNAVSLGDEFHWATTGPKLLCIVLSMCLLTVSTYGFWRLNFPALHTSSETFYARQGIVKSLLFLFIGSLAELFFLVTQYQKMYGLTMYHPVWLTSTALLGVKGLALSMLCSFLDTEVLHGTCCPSYEPVSEPEENRHGFRQRRDEEGGAERRDLDEDRQRERGRNRNGRYVQGKVGGAENIEICEPASLKRISPGTNERELLGLTEKDGFV